MIRTHSDYYGCDNTIAEYLQNGAHIKAAADTREFGTVSGYIIAYSNTYDKEFSYIMFGDDDDFYFCKNPTILDTVYRVLDHDESVKALCENGFRYVGAGKWVNEKSTSWIVDDLYWLKYCGNTFTSKKSAAGLRDLELLPKFLYVEESVKR